jgi:hypothetical protein
LHFIDTKMLKTISDLYKFYLYHPINGLVEVFPYNKTMEWAWEKNKEESQAFTRKKLSTELLFKKNDFFLLYDLERSNYKCEKITLEIHRECNGGFSLFYSGYIALIDGDYDRDKCMVKIKLRQDDEYNCILKDWTKEKDFIGGVGAPLAVDEIRFQDGDLEYETCEGPEKRANTFHFLPKPEDLPIITTCLDVPQSWSHVENYYSIQNIPINDGFYLYREKSVFVREFKYTDNLGSSPVAPPGNGWIPIEIGATQTKWVRAVASEYKIPLGNGRKLNDVIQYLIQECGLTFVSDFFNKNPDNTNPTNFAYDYAEQFYKELVIWQKSDVKRQPRVITLSDGSTQTLEFIYSIKALIKLKDLLKWLYEMYNVQWAIIGNTFRIEHYTYWNSSLQNLIDLTQNERIKGNYNYKYISEELPEKETWTWMEESDRSDFDGLPITYDEICSYGEDDAKDEEFNISKITTNVDFIVKNQSKISDDGFVIASTENSIIQSEICRITNTLQINGCNALSNLLYHLHRHGRPQRQGNMNGTDETFYFPKPKRQGPDVSVPMCCDEVETFDTNFRVKTQMGWGNMVSAKLKDPNGIMTISLLHE